MVQPAGTFPSYQNPAQPNNDYIPESTSMIAEDKLNNPEFWGKGNNQKTNNFNPNSLYNIGNFAGGAYDIYRGLKGGDPVNYERVDPSLVDYQQSRDLTRRDIQTGFRGTRDILKNVNNPGAYLNLISQAAGNRDQTTSDAITRSVEAERNANAGIINQSKYANAATQRAEADQLELANKQTQYKDFPQAITQ